MNNFNLNWLGSFCQGQGYSGASENTCVALSRAGVDVSVMRVTKYIRKNITNEGWKILQKPFRLANVGVAMSLPVAFDSLMNKVKIGFTMFETDKLPTGQVWAGRTGKCSDIINEMDRLWVPCEHNKKLFLESGIKIPIDIVHLGVNDEIYSYIERPKRKKFTFLVLGTLTLRKNPGVVLCAFLNLFKNNPDVQLVFKTTSGSLIHAGIETLSKNIKVIDRMSTQEEMIGYYRDADCFIFPSRGEGYGLPPMEAMATGLPTIVSDNTGMSEFCNKKYNYPLMMKGKSRAIRFPKDWGDVGNWYEADQSHLEFLMKYIYEHQDEAREKGRDAAKWVKKEWAYKATAKRIIEILKKL